MPAGFEVRRFLTLDDARTEWRNAEESGVLFPFQSYEWLAPWFRHVADRRRLAPAPVSVTDREGRSMLFLPMGIEQRGMARCLVWLGGVNSDYHAPILGNHLPQNIGQDAFRTLWQAVKAALPPFDAVHLEKQPERIGDRPNPFLHLVSRANLNSSHAAHLGKPWADFYHSRRNAKSRATDRRKERLLHGQGEVVFLPRVLAAEAGAALEWLVRHKTRRSAAQGVRDVLSLPGHAAFYAELLSAGPSRFDVMLSVLRLDGSIVAAHWGLVHGDRFYWLLPAFDEERFGASSPGTMLLRRLLEWSCEQNLGVFDFTIGDEGYKSHWCDGTLGLYDHVEGTTPQGKVYAALVNAKHTILESAKERPRVAAALRAARRLRMAGRALLPSSLPAAPGGRW